jgi:phospholipase C
MGIQEDLISALRESSAWDSSAYIITYDEHGGYFEHVEPPVLDAFGAGIRIPTWVISPFAKPSHLEPAVYDLTSTLKFLENVFGLPTLASVNHLFDDRPRAGRTTRPPGAGRPGRPRHRGMASTRSATLWSASPSE